MFRYFFPFLMIATFAAQARANPCEHVMGRHQSASHLEAGSVPNNELGEHLNASQYSHGIKLDIGQIGGDLQVDVISYPEETPLAAGLFILLQMARLAEDDFARLVLIDANEELFFFDGRIARENGCKAVWGLKVAPDGSSPLPLFVDLMGAAEDADGNALIPRYSGNWLSKMNTALEAFNTVVAPSWIFSAAAG